MLRVMPETGGRAAGEGGQNQKGAVDAVQARDRWSHLPGEPDAVKAASPGSEGGRWKRAAFLAVPRWRSTLVVGKERRKKGKKES